MNNDDPYNKCLGRNSDDHCCYINGQVCSHLEENTEPGYRWSCRLRRELGSWDAVLSDPRYAPIKAAFAPHGYDCSTWPDRKCTTCGFDPSA
jgi:hypothetical protein